MRLPPFSGVGLTAFNKNNEDITSKLFAPNGFMKVDADYSGKPYFERYKWLKEIPTGRIIIRRSQPGLYNGPVSI